MQRITPYVDYEDVPAAIEWLSRAFGFAEVLRWTDQDGRVGHAEITLGEDASVMLGNPGKDFREPITPNPYFVLSCQVDDVDAHFARARAAGARIEREPTDWVEIPAGTLVQGTDERDVDELVRRHADLQIPPEWFRKECPRREVLVATFAISRTPVTNAQWAPFARERGHHWRPAGGPDHPVAGVTWVQAAEYATWLAGVTGLPVRLPWEQEWERAARGDDAREFPWGDEFHPGGGNLRCARHGRSVPVGSFPAGASPFGVLDLAGNVDEWTATEYSPYPDAPPSVPARETWAADPHVTRGGSWQHDRDLARCARRHGAYDPALSDTGLRLAFSR